MIFVSSNDLLIHYEPSSGPQTLWDHLWTQQGYNSLKWNEKKLKIN